MSAAEDYEMTRAVRPKKEKMPEKKKKYIYTIKCIDCGMPLDWGNGRSDVVCPRCLARRNGKII